MNQMIYRLVSHDVTSEYVFLKDLFLSLSIHLTKDDAKDFSNVRNLEGDNIVLEESFATRIKNYHTYNLK
eukprot:snap_masked-scaffold_9-processed-gene-2.34-mRNA-1 protein AED:1.00 eAED:1.00 QI:0/0/0/0/1/1/2/0/69